MWLALPREVATLVKQNAQQPDPVEALAAS
jgi:hypothetical protein